MKNWQHHNGWCIKSRPSVHYIAAGQCKNTYEIHKGLIGRSECYGKVRGKVGNLIEIH